MHDLNIIDSPHLAARLLLLVFFLPFFIVVFIQWRRLRGALHRGMIRNELIAVGTTYGALVGALLALYGLAAGGWMARPGEYPEILGLVRYDVQPGAILILLLISSGLALLGRRIWPRLGYRPIPASFRLSRLVNMGALGLLILLMPFYTWFNLFAFILCTVYTFLLVALIPSSGEPIVTSVWVSFILLGGSPLLWMVSHIYSFTPSHALYTLAFAAVGWRLLRIRYRS